MAMTEVLERPLMRDVALSDKFEQEAGDQGGAEMTGIFVALGLGGLFKALVSVGGVFKGSVEWAQQIGKTGFYVGTDISPMLMAVPWLTFCPRHGVFVNHGSHGA